MTPAQLSPLLRIMQWNTESNCKYTCMHQITDLGVANKEKIHQYYGKWPFYRLWGMQEPASVFFSLLNLVGHMYGWSKVQTD
jgi:post-GPI attachment to proteins factor 3